jgi:hypothetical protein
VSTFERIACVIGSALIGFSAYVAVERRKRIIRARRNRPPVEELTEGLRQAWAGYHNP